MFGVENIRSRFEEVRSAVDVDALSGSDAARLTRELTSLERMVGALRLSCSQRAVDCNAHVGSGARDSVAWLASVAGTSVVDARRSLETARSLSDRPELASAVASGAVSLAQAGVIASAPASAVGGLVDRAGSVSMRELRDETRRACSSGSEEARRAQMVSRRFHRSWTDELGMLRGEYALLPEEGAVVRSRMKAKVDQVFREARRSGQLRAHESYEADALMSLVGGSGSKAGGRRTAELIVIADYEALVRGHVAEGETCEVEGIGPVPVSVVERIRNDCYLSVILRKNSSPVLVDGKGHYIPDKLRVAVRMRDRSCRVPGCGSSFELQVDHITPVAKGGATTLENLWLLCPRHHGLKTKEDFRTDGKARQWEPATVATLFDTS